MALSAFFSRLSVGPGIISAVKYCRGNWEERDAGVHCFQQTTLRKCTMETRKSTFLTKVYEAS